MKRILFPLFFLCVDLLCFVPEHAAASKSVEFRYFFRDRPQETLDRLSLEEKIGQVLIFGFYGDHLDPEYEEWLGSGRLGNIKIFLRNVKSREQIRALNGSIADLALQSPQGIPPFIATDMEGGTVNHIRYRGIYLAPAAGLLGATGSLEYGRKAARLIALTLYNHGINMNFAPCVDVLTDGRNRVIGTRSYSSDPEIVTGMARVFIEEHKRLGILATAKHFPGHGMTRYDSHISSAVVDLETSELDAVHVRPYLSLIEDHTLDGIMVSHITYSALDSFYPASLSDRVIDEYLRGHLGFRGIVVTDDLEMQGTDTQAGDIIKTFMLAFRAGNDLLLVSHTKESQQLLMETLPSLFERGLLDEKELDRKVLRILETKRRYLARFYGTHGGQIVQEHLMARAIEETLALTPEGMVLMSSHLEGTLPSLFDRLVRSKARGLILSPSTSFAVRAKRYLPLFDLVDIGFYPDKQENWQKLVTTKNELRQYDFILLGFANERHMPWARECARSGVPYAILSYDNPQYARYYSSSALFIATCFGPYNPAAEMLFQAVFKTGSFPGHFPYDF
jgi:beta-glucosidase-like glycosyl hydrolase